jgi:hypothetical protein
MKTQHLDHELGHIWDEIQKNLQINYISIKGGVEIWNSNKGCALNFVHCMYFENLI